MVDVADIIILSNGPGELATWVKPVVQQLQQQLEPDHIRVSVVLSPCPHASGREATIARSYPEVERVLEPQHFFPFLLWGKTPANWDWHRTGVVVFLGGDQFYPVVVGKRLGYRTVVYAEWEARWHRWIDRFGTMRPEIATHAAQKHAHKFTIVGDLMAEAGRQDSDQLTTNSHRQSEKINVSLPSEELIGLLPGSKASKLAQGVPFVLAIAECIQADRPQARFVIPVAPALNLPTLASFADPQQNPIISDLGGIAAELILPDSGALPFLKTTNGVQVHLWTRSPAYDLLAQCQLCLTTVGANTAELGALAVPMIVLLPTQRLDALPLDGLPGLLAYIPGVGAGLAKVINWWALRQRGLLAWPNIWAQTTIVPELVGNLQPQEVANLALGLLNHPEQLQQMREKLRSVRGEPGAAAKLAKLICEELEASVARTPNP